MLFYVFTMPDPCSFLVGLFLIMLASFHLYLWLADKVFFNVIFFAVLLSRIFYHQKMGEWGFGLVTELLFLSLYFRFFKFFLQKEKRSEEESRIEPVLYLIPFFGIGFWNLIYLGYSITSILIHINFIFAASALIFLLFFAANLTQLKSAFVSYIIGNLSIGFFLAESLPNFLMVSSVFLLSNLIFAGLLFLKAKSTKNNLSEILLANKKEGIQTLLFVYFIILGLLLTQLNPLGAALALYSNWLLGLAIQIGFLTALNY